LKRRRFALEMLPGSVGLVGMRSSSAAVAANYVDSGQPVENPPPLVELVGFGEATELPPVIPTAESAPPAIVKLSDPVPVLADTGRLIEPTETLPEVAPPRGLPAPERWRATCATLPAGPWLALPKQWLRAAQATLPARWPAPPERWLRAAKTALPVGRSPRMAIAAGVVVVLAVGLAAIAGIGPFSRTGQYRPSSPPPSDPAQRVAYYQAGTKARDANAEMQLAILYAKGEGVTQDYTIAANLFRAAADQGMTRAQYDLGVLYERGRGVPVDLTQAANWYLKAAEGKYPLAEYNLAVCYTKGQGIRQDVSEAALWYRRAAGQGVVQAMINLAVMYEKGEGVPASAVDAYAWYQAAGRRASQAAARRAEDLYATLPRLDQIRAEALASDVAASIHDPKLERTETAVEKP